MPLELLASPCGEIEVIPNPANARTGTHENAPWKAVRWLNLGIGTALLVLLSLVSLPTAHAEPAAGLTGIWTTESGREIFIGPCEQPDSHAICGIAAKGDLAELDVDTAEPADTKIRFREQPLRFLRMVAPAALGKVVLEGFESLDGRFWRGGFIFNPRSGKKYKATLLLKNPDELAVMGCYGPVCGGQTWRRKG